MAATALRAPLQIQAVLPCIRQLAAATKAPAVKATGSQGLISFSLAPVPRTASHASRRGTPLGKAVTRRRELQLKVLNLQGYMTAQSPSWMMCFSACWARKALHQRRYWTCKIPNTLLMVLKCSCAGCKFAHVHELPDRCFIDAHRI